MTPKNRNLDPCGRLSGAKARKKAPQAEKNKGATFLGLAPLAPFSHTITSNFDDGTSQTSPRHQLF